MEIFQKSSGKFKNKIYNIVLVCDFFKNYLHKAPDLKVYFFAIIF